jgi:uncharacterized protein (TIGR01244 family)
MHRTFHPPACDGMLRADPDTAPPAPRKERPPVPIRKITDKYHVSPQITPEDFDEIEAAGVRTIICNRPDDENPADLQIAQMQAAAEARGVRFVALPFNQMTLTPEILSSQRETIAQSDGPVLAYCASGTRSTMAWALGQAEIGAQSADDLLAAASKAGYDLSGLRPTLETLVSRANGAD